MKICKKCKRNNDNDAKVCYGCGAALHGGMKTNDGTVRKNTSVILWAAITSLVLVVIMLAVGFNIALDRTKDIPVVQEQDVVRISKPDDTAEQTQPSQNTAAKTPSQSRYTNYLKELSGSVGIYSGPGYDFNFVQNVGQYGTYTIVEEKTDSSGNLWGKLKSGVGWVMLEAGNINTQSSSSNVPYKIMLGADVSVFAGCGYDHSHSSVVGRTGEYTIVREQFDNEGNLWGELKSGVGWVDLSKQVYYKKSAVSANYADIEFIESKKYNEYISSDFPKDNLIAIRVYENISDVRIVTMNVGNNGNWVEGKTLYKVKSLSPSKGLLTNLGFPGDYTTYSILFKDSNNNQRCFMMTQSGRNGELSFHE